MRRSGTPPIERMSRCDQRLVRLSKVEGSEGDDRNCPGRNQRLARLGQNKSTINDPRGETDAA